MGPGTRHDVRDSSHEAVGASFFLTSSFLTVRYGSVTGNRSS